MSCLGKTVWRQFEDFKRMSCIQRVDDMAHKQHASMGNFCGTRHQANMKILTPMENSRVRSSNEIRIPEAVKVVKKHFFFCKESL